MVVKESLVRGVVLVVVPVVVVPVAVPVVGVQLLVVALRLKNVSHNEVHNADAW